jgi:RNA-splicing ligase RtcB
VPSWFEAVLLGQYWLERGLVGSLEAASKFKIFRGIMLRAERWIEEARSACEAIEPVIAVQAKAGLVHVVARLRPVLY